MCSGYEGVGLSLAFVGASLWLFRDRLRFPRALVLLPIVTLVSWIANVARLDALVLVGTYLSEDLAAGGFHSYAGVLLFCAVALGTVAAALRIRWLVRPDPPADGDAAAAPPGGDVSAKPDADAAAPAPGPPPHPAPYLAPVMAMIGAGLVARAFASPGHEPLAFLPPLAGAVGLAGYRRAYRTMSWAAWPRALLVGLVAAAVALALDRLGGRPSAMFDPAAGAAALAAALPSALIVAPLADELAFRGFLARRLCAAAFEELPPARIDARAVIISALAFGLVQPRPLSGVATGAVYALWYRRAGRLGDAVVAHATANAALLAAAWLAARRSAGL
jgi:exosortase E/protease (VPEID-CTERM system)